MIFRKHTVNTDVSMPKKTDQRFRPFVPRKQFLPEFGMPRWFRRFVLWPLLTVFVFAFLGELFPEAEKRCRQAVRATFFALLPATTEARIMEVYGWREISPGKPERPWVVLVHGLDEPGDIWDVMIPQLQADGFGVVRFDYPNDQGIAASAALLRREIEARPDRRIALVGHSMGGLVIREMVDFKAPSQVCGVVTVGTPWLGSDWARFRIWLELRDAWAHRDTPGGPLLRLLADGCGEAKVDLRPASRLLRNQQATPWPRNLPALVIAGHIKAPSDFGSNALGDGVVTLESATSTNGLTWIYRAGTHRGLLRGTRPEAILPARMFLRSL